MITVQHQAQDNRHQVIEPIHLQLLLVQMEDGIVRAIDTTASVGAQASPGNTLY
jgi:hypothetical protein